MTKLSPRHPITLALAAALAACGGEDEPTNNGTNTRPIQCRSADYVAFDEANYLNQQLRVQAYVDMIDLMKAAESAEPFDPSLAATNFGEAARLYRETASLQEKVQGRTDDHFEDKPVVGADIDADIAAALERGRTATVALDAKLARQTVDKQLVHFFYLSVVHEMMLGQRGKWDEAFGYAGMGPENREENRKALAAVATSRDATNNTTLADDIFNGLIDGACALAEALEAADADEIDYTTDPALKATVDALDRDLQLVLAYSAGHEAIDMVELQADLASNPGDAALREQMHVKLAELDPYFEPIERLMERAGGASATRAATIRAEIDAALGSPDETWMQSFDAQGVVDALEVEFEIDIRG